MINILTSNTPKAQTDALISIDQNLSSINNSHIIICEDRFSMTLEQVILEKSQGTFSTNVYSFSRLLYQLLKNKEKKTYLTQTGQVMAVSKILIDNAKEFKCYSSLAKNYSSLSSSIVNVLSQLKSSYVKVSDLDQNLDISEALKLKLFDLNLVYKSYEEFKGSLILDASDKFELLAELIKTSPLIKNSTISVVGFTSFTKQIYSILGSLFVTAKDVNVFTFSSENACFDTSIENNLIDLCKQLDLPFNVLPKNQVLSCEKQGVFKFLFNYQNTKTAEKIPTSNIRIKQCNDLKSELEFVSKEILKLVKTQGLRFSDIGIMGANISLNKNVFKSVLSKFDIPFFIDDSQKLSSHILSKCIISSLKLSIKDFEMEDILTLIYSPFFEISTSEKCNFENYLIKVNVKPRSFFNDRFFKDEKFLDLRNLFVERFFVNLLEIDKCSNFSSCVKDLIERFSPCIDVLKTSFSDFSLQVSSSVTDQIKEKLLSTLLELDGILGSSTMLLVDFIKILSDALVASEVSTLPLYTDCVFVGDFSTSKFSSFHTLFATSINNKLVPFEKTDLGLITDRDIDSLNGNKIFLEPKIAEVNQREKLNTFLGLISFDKKLYLSYSLFNTENEQSLPSEVIEVFLDIFKTQDGLSIKLENEISDLSSENLLYDFIKQNLTSKRLLLNELALSLSASCFDNKDIPLSSTLALGLKQSGLDSEVEQILSSTNINTVEIDKVDSPFKDKTTYSVSMLESYFACPYANFVKNALYAKERPVGNIMAFDTGNYLHNALELFMKDINTTTISNIKEKVEEISATIKSTPPYSYFDESAKTNFALKKLDNEFLDIATELVRRKEQSAFLPLGQEITFGKGKTMKPIKLESGNFLRGAIDFADTYDNNVRVIDYKTGKVDSSVESIFYGLKFQPYIYLSAIRDELKLNPSGALYLPIKDKFTDNDSTAVYKMSGFVSASKDVYENMDFALKDNGAKSQIVPIELKKNGELSARSNALTPTEFNSFIDYSLSLSEGAISEMKEGNIKPSPFKGKCDHCKFKPICSYDVNFFGERNADGKVSKDTVLKGVKDE